MPWLFEENAVVISTRDLGANVREGEKGTIVMVYDQAVGDYEVEFLDVMGNHLDLLRVTSETTRGARKPVERSGAYKVRITLLRPKSGVRRRSDSAEKDYLISR